MNELIYIFQVYYSIMNAIVQLNIFINIYDLVPCIGKEYTSSYLPIYIQTCHLILMAARNLCNREI